VCWEAIIHEFHLGVFSEQFRPGPSERSRGSCTQQIPLIPRDIAENDNAAVRFVTRRTHESDECTPHAFVGRSEIVHPQEKAYSTGGLFAN